MGQRRQYKRLGAKFMITAKQRALEALDELGAGGMLFELGEHLATIRQCLEEQGWQPIETAPEDGMYLVANKRGEVCACNCRDGFRVIHNMPAYADWTGL